MGYLRIFDTHAHLYLDAFHGELGDILARAREAGVHKILNAGIDLSTSILSIGLAEKYPDIFYAAVGVHPHNSQEFDETTLAQLRELADHPKVVAIGEIGLDYYKNYSPPNSQVLAFRLQLRLAQELGKPVLVHIRQAHRDALRIIEEENFSEGGILHCFSGDENTAQKGVELGFHIGIGGTVTYPNASKIRRVVKSIPIDRLVIETDAPYLTPQPRRRYKNEPAYLKFVLDELSEILDMERQALALKVYYNAHRALKLPFKQPSFIYPLKNSLYINLTNRCTNQCRFCLRNFCDDFYGYNLLLEDEPSVEEVLEAIKNAPQFEEAVFCGFGEPLIRLDALLAIAKALKARGYRVRVDTNGHGNLIHGKNIVPLLAENVDAISISLNAEKAEKYTHLCRPHFGKRTFEEVIKFAQDCVKHIGQVELTVVDLPDVDINACREIASSIGAKFRVRAYYGG